MKDFKFLFFLASLLCLFASSQAVASCKDDPRLYSIGSFLEEQRQGSAAPLELTAETFLQLTPTVREAIGDNLVIFDSNCKPMQVFRGEPAVRVEVSFPLIYHAFYDAVLRRDTTTQQVILRSFKPTPVDAMEFMSLLSPISIEPAIANRLAQAANVSISDAFINRQPSATEFVNGHTGISRCNDSGHLTFADFFNRFGGTVYGRNGKAWFVVTANRNILSVDNRISSTPLVGSCRLRGQDLISRIESADAIAILLPYNPNQDFPSGRLNSIYTAYNQWVKDGSPDTAPTSLFD